MTQFKTGCCVQTTQSCLALVQGHFQAIRGVVLWRKLKTMHMHTDFIQRNLFDFELSLKYPVPLPVRAPSRTEYDKYESFSCVKHVQISFHVVKLTSSELFLSEPAAASNINNQQNHLNLYILPRTIFPDEFFGMESMNSMPPVNHLY